MAKCEVQLALAPGRRPLLYCICEPSPLTRDLARYAEFFALFGSFQGYVDFFLLQDPVAGDDSTVRFWAPFDGFASSPLPVDVDAYLRYRAQMMMWIDARNRRIGRSSESSRRREPWRVA